MCSWWCTHEHIQWLLKRIPWHAQIRLCFILIKSIMRRLYQLRSLCISWTAISFFSKEKKSLFIGSACYICHWYTRLNKNYGKNKRIEKIQNERQYFDIAYSICYWCVFSLCVLLHILFFSVCLFPHPFEVHNNRRL